MTATPKDDSLPRSVMFLCVGAALLLLLLQGQSCQSGLRSRTAAPRSTTGPESTLLPATPADAASLVVNLSRRRVYVYKQQQLLASYPVAIGQDGWETPTGSFHVFQMQVNPAWIHPITGQLVPPGSGNPLGKRWIGFWSNGHLQAGFHGTNQEELIGQAVSHGCLRMRNQDIEALYKQVSLGSPVIVRK